MLMNPLMPSQYVVRWKVFIDSQVWIAGVKYAGFVYSKTQSLSEVFKMTKLPLSLLQSITLLAVFFPPVSSAQALLDTPAYCPNTLTDTDGDGIGIENGRPCIVRRSGSDVAVCSLATDDTDSDRDGWGWDGNNTCLIDNTTVDKDFTVTDANGVTTTGQNVAPIIDTYVREFGDFAFDMQVDSNGTVYNFRVPDGTLAATNIDGNTIWELKIFGFIRGLTLDVSEEILYTEIQSIGVRIVAYSVDGTLLWQSEDLGQVVSVDLGRDAIIVGVDNVSDRPGGTAFSLVSLNYDDGTVRWEFDPGTELGPFALNNNGRVFVKDQSGPHGNETTFILAQ